MSETQQCFYTCVLADDKCVMADDKHVIIGIVTEGGGNFKVKRVERKIPRDWYWDLKGWKIVPVFFDYDVIFQLLVSMIADMYGVKLKEAEQVVSLEGAALLLQQLLAEVMGSKGNPAAVDEPIIGKKAKDSIIQFGLDGAKLHELLKDCKVKGDKAIPQEYAYLFEGTKLKLSEIYGLLQGLKAKIEESNVPLTGAKIQELVKEHFFEGKVDIRALLYLLFEEDGIEGASLVDKLTNKELFMLLDEDEDESEEQ